VPCRKGLIRCRSLSIMSLSFLESECPVCFEELFNENGQCEDAEGVAATVCHHVVHVRCLTSLCSSREEHDHDSAEESGSSSCLFGQTNRHCPVCSRSVTIYSSSSEAAYFPGFWIPFIQSCIERFAPSGEEALSLSLSSGEGLGMIETTLSRMSLPSLGTCSSRNSSNTRIPAALIRKELRNDTSLTDSQKKFIDAPSNAGLQQALVWAGKVHRTSSTLNHARGSSISSSPASTSPTSSAITLPGMSTRGLWQYDAQSDEICPW
jgi:hypothetical protein